MRGQHQKVRAAALALALLAVLVPSLLPAASASVKDQATVRVAYPIQKGITDKDGEGRYTGYTYEFLEEVAQYTGWDYEFVEVPGEDVQEQLVTLMEMLDEGTVDLMGAMLYSDQMAERYSFSSYNYGMVETVLQVPDDMASEFAINSQVWQDLRVAAGNPEGQYARELRDYCSINRFHLSFVPCGTEEEQVAAVREGRADALLNTSMNAIANVKTIAAFASKPVYFASRKDWDNDMMSQLNQAIHDIAQSNPTFMTELMEKYFPSTGTRSFTLSEAERAYIKDLGVLRVGVLEDWPPYQWRDEQGELRGIAVDLLRQVAEVTGLELSFVPVPESKHLFEVAASGEVELIAGIPYSYELARQFDFSLLRPFLSSGYSMVTADPDGTTEGKRVALSMDSPYRGITGGEELLYSAASLCVQAVADGEADCAIVDSYTAQYYRNQSGYNRLRVIPTPGELRQITCGLVSPRESGLISILNRAILSLPDENIQSIVTQNIAISSPLTVRHLIEENPVAVVAGVVALAGLIIVMILIIQHQRTKANRRLALEMEKHRQIYALVNDVFFEYDYRSGQLTLTYPEGELRPLRVLLAYDAEDPTAAQKRTRRELIRQLRAQRDGVDEVALLCVDGTEHWIRLAMQTVRDGDRPVYSIGKLNLIDDERREKDSLLALAQRDSLTQAYNAATIRERVEAELSQGGALIIMDVDRFKNINDTLGHLEGDRVLVGITQTVAGSIREDDLVGRPGGDEFLIFLPGVGAREALDKRCAVIRERVRELRLLDGNCVTVSMGAALVRPGETYDELYARADKALYQAKEKGRDCFVVADEDSPVSE